MLPMLELAFETAMGMREIYTLGSKQLDLRKRTIFRISKGPCLGRTSIRIYSRRSAARSETASEGAGSRNSARTVDIKEDWLQMPILTRLPASCSNTCVHFLNVSFSP